MTLSSVANNGAPRILASKSGSGHKNIINRDVDAHVNGEARPRSGRKAGAIKFFLLNIVFLVCVFLLSTFGNTSGHNPALYLVLLVALLSSPLLFVRSFTGPYMVLVISALLFFVMFGLGDFVGYFSDVSSIYEGSTKSILSHGEAGVLVAFLFLFLGYASAVGTLRSKTGRWFTIDWPIQTTLIVGFLFFTAGIIATFAAQVRFSAFEIHNPKIDVLVMNAIVLSRMVGELGEILLAYVLVKTRSRAITIFILALIIFKLPLGIILNAKYIGVSFIAIYMVVAWIYNKRIPWKLILVGGLIITLLFPLAYTYRAYMGKYHVSVGDTLEDIPGHLSKALSEEVSNQKKKGLMDAISGGLTSIAERANMKPSVELIMARTGKDLPYQGGYTLTPIFYILIPRFILPDKPDVPVGQIFNQDFKIAGTPETWISTSFIGELYWNFSWFGIVAGMLIVGYIFGAVGSITSLDTCTNIARILIVLITIATLVFKFQTGIAQQYSVFIRSLIIVIFLHMFLRTRKKRARTA